MFTVANEAATVKSSSRMLLMKSGLAGGTSTVPFPVLVRHVVETRDTSANRKQSPMPRPSAVAERRRQILEATCEVVAERGFRELRIADVAKAAGFSTATVHYYFNSKEKLLTEAFRFQYEESVARRQADLSIDDNPVERLRQLAASYLPSSDVSIKAWRVWLELWVSALQDHALAGVNNHYYGQWRQEVLDSTRDAIDQGLIVPTDSVVFTDAFVGMLDGLAIQVLVHSEHMSVARIKATYESFIDHYLA
jgi:AcrR family transcriptional regulator